MTYVLSRTFSHSQGRLWTEPLQSQRTEQDWMLLHVDFGAVGTNVPFSMSEFSILLHGQTSCLSVKTIVVTDKQIPHLHELADLHSSSKQRPDMSILTMDMKRIIMCIEVQSSPMLETERKATLLAKDLIRLLRCRDESFQGISVFCFPNSQSKRCIIGIKAVWRDFYIRTTLIRYTTVELGIQKLKKMKCGAVISNGVSSHSTEHKF